MWRGAGGRRCWLVQCPVRVCEPVRGPTPCRRSRGDQANPIDWQPARGAAGENFFHRAPIWPAGDASRVSCGTVRGVPGPRIVRSSTSRCDRAARVSSGSLKAGLARVRAGMCTDKKRAGDRITAISGCVLADACVFVIGATHTRGPAGKWPKLAAFSASDLIEIRPSSCGECRPSWRPSLRSSSSTTSSLPS